MKKHNEFLKMLFEVLLIFLVAATLGLFNKSVNNKDKESSECPICQTIDYDFENTSNEILKTYFEIIEKFYGDIDPENLRNAAIDAMLKSLEDPNSLYMDNDDANSFLEKMRGEYKGLGLEIYNGEKGITVLTVFGNSPAANAGIMVDDVIISVDGQNVTEMSATQVSQIIKYGKSDDVVLEILRNDQIKPYSFTKATIILESVKHKIIEQNKKKIGYIELSTFANNSYDQFKDALENLENSKINGLVIDIRNNAGGYLHIVTDILELFIKKGEALYQTRDKDGTVIIKDTTDDKRTYPITVLVNGVSASASEILAGGLQESYGATIIGTNTFGKGTVQETISFSNGTLVKITTKEWLTPTGKRINNVGIELDYEVELLEDYSGEIDNQLKKALDVLKSEMK